MNNNGVGHVVFLGRDFLGRKDSQNKGPASQMGLATKPECVWIAVSQGERG